MLKDSWTDYQFSQSVFEDQDTTASFLRDLQKKKESRITLVTV